MLARTRAPTHHPCTHAHALLDVQPPNCDVARVPRVYSNDANTNMYHQIIIYNPPVLARDGHRLEGAVYL